MTAWTTAETDVVVWSASEGDGSTADELRVGYAIDLNLWGTPAIIQNVHASEPWGYNDYQFANDAFSGSVYFIKSRAATFGAHAIVQDGDQLGNIIFGGDDGVTYNNASAAIIAYADGPPGVGDVPGRLSFQVAPAGGSSGVFGIVEALSINSDKTSDFASTVNITPPFDGTTNLPGLNVANFTGGTPAQITTDFAYNKIVVANDTTSASAANFVTSAFSVELDTGGPNINNEKTAIRAVTSLNVASANYNQDIQAIVGQVSASQTMGGTDTGSGAKGAIYAINPSSVASSGAANLAVVSGGEVDAWILSPATAAFRWGWSMVSGGDTQAATSDAAINFSSATTTAWKHILSITANNGHGGVAAGSTVIGSDGTSMSAANFADLHTFTFSGDILYFSTFRVTGAGDLSANSLLTATVTVANLPAASSGNKGMRMMVSNATATTFWSIVAGSGANIVPVTSDGTNWRIG